MSLPSWPKPETALQRSDRLQAEIAEQDRELKRRWRWLVLRGIILALVGLAAVLGLIQVAVGSSLWRDLGIFGINTFLTGWHGSFFRKERKELAVFRAQRAELEGQVATVALEVADPDFARSLRAASEHP